MDSKVNLRLKYVDKICVLNLKDNYMLYVDFLDIGEKVFLWCFVIPSFFMAFKCCFVPYPKFLSQ